MAESIGEAVSDRSAPLSSAADLLLAVLADFSSAALEAEEAGGSEDDDGVLDSAGVLLMLYENHEQAKITAIAKTAIPAICSVFTDFFFFLYLIFYKFSSLGNDARKHIPCMK